jgi:hypothetical protein
MPSSSMATASMSPTLPGPRAMIRASRRPCSSSRQDRKPVLFAGNEGYPYAECANGDFDRTLWQPLSLMGQPRHKMRALNDELRDAGLRKFPA